MGWPPVIATASLYKTLNVVLAPDAATARTANNPE